MALLRVAGVLYGPSRVIAAHVDHATRADSARVAAALGAHCRQEGLRFEVERLQPPSFDEATLRDLRYAALDQIRQRVGALWVLVAHTADDQAETVLMRLLRTGGVDSLAGMPPQNRRVLRPWLRVARSEVHRYLEQKAWPYWEDPSNREPMFLRNRVRKELLPLIDARYARGVTTRLAATAAEASERLKDDARPPRSSAERRAPVVAPPPMDEGWAWLEAGIRVQRCTQRAQGHAWGAGKAIFDAVALPSLSVRNFRPGDRIRPFGWSTGRRKVSDVFGEAGVPVGLRGRYPVVTDEEDAVIWVPKLLRGARAPVTDATREVWMLFVG